ncbi:MAG: methanogenesis marker 2 protein [Candidatus Helarchaeota archaeon]|nr:methanogenesis marker 2 protein [Candidatus Helarchaeota archaeon]
MNIKDLANFLAQFEGITRKYPISELILPLTENIKHKYSQLDIIGSFGEDSAIIEVSETSHTHYFLLAMDGMWSKLIQADPLLAGYFAVLVNVNDIICKGGIPIALLDILAYQDETIGKALVRGMVQGTEKFGVPIVGGHLHPNNDYDSLSIAVFGVVPKDEVIFSNTAQLGDDIIIAVDLDGRFHEKFKYAWDTTTHKPPKQVQANYQIMRAIAEKKLMHAAKDISNPGMVGTLGMLLDASNVGGVLDLTKIPIMREEPLERWLCMYPGFGIVSTCSPSNSKNIIRIFESNEIAASVCGAVEEGHSLYISDGEEKALVLDFKKNFVSGIPK